MPSLLICKNTFTYGSKISVCHAFVGGNLLSSSFEVAYFPVCFRYPASHLVFVSVNLFCVCTLKERSLTSNLRLVLYRGCTIITFTLAMSAFHVEFEGASYRVTEMEEAHKRESERFDWLNTHTPTSEAT